jgi:hypothetical protein
MKTKIVCALFLIYFKHFILSFSYFLLVKILIFVFIVCFAL